MKEVKKKGEKKKKNSLRKGPKSHPVDLPKVRRIHSAPLLDRLPDLRLARPQHPAVGVVDDGQLVEPDEGVEEEDVLQGVASVAAYVAVD
jgi:hypothetical protein